MTPADWAISEPDDDGDIHIIPIDDLYPHHTENCTCQPWAEDSGTGITLWTHNSFDKRELYENGTLKPN